MWNQIKHSPNNVYVNIYTGENLLTGIKTVYRSMICLALPDAITRTINILKSTIGL